MHRIRCTLPHEAAYMLTIIIACMYKDIKSAFSERIFTLLGIFIPVNFLILMSLFFLAGNHAPTAVVMNDTGPYAHQFYVAMEQAHSFRLQRASTRQGHALLQAGQVVALVTIPGDFDLCIEHKQPVRIGVEINNLNTDFTNDIRRAIPLTITSFYAKAFPSLVTITMHEHDLYAQDTDYIPYLGVSIFVLGMTVAGILQAGMASAREWELGTIKEILLSPASRTAVMIGKIAGALVMSLLSVLVLLVVLIFGIGIYPAHWGEVLFFTLPALVIFMAWGVVLGTWLKHRIPVTALGIGLAVPLFFVSGAFGPLSLNTKFVSVLAQSLPFYYAIVLQQHAFHNFMLNTYSLKMNFFILCAYGAGLLVVAVSVLRRSTTAH